jgi:hypothetical protein
MHDINAIISELDRYLEQTGQPSLTPAEANKQLEKAGLLKDSKGKAGTPLRKLLRKKLLPHAYQMNGKWTRWNIPHSSKRTNKK